MYRLSPIIEVRHSLKKFNEIIDGLNLTQSEKKPVGFLKAKVGNLTRYEIYANEIFKIAIKL